MFRFNLGLFIILTLSSCDKETEKPDLLVPSNLQVSISETEGKVEVELQAANANFYRVYFYDSLGNSLLMKESADGKISHTLPFSGKFPISSRAYASYEGFIEQWDTIEVDLPSNNSLGLPGSGYSTPLQYPNYQLVWNDEFSGTQLSSDWNLETGTGSNGWGNNELQYYREENVRVEDGFLIITAKNETFGGRNYTSSRLTTRGKKSFKYGRIDIRAALPQGQGIWPALWMLGDSFTTVGWPKCGEIDIMEMVGGSGNDRGDNFIFGTIHWDNNGTKAEYGGSNKINSGKFADEWHVFTIIWDSSSIKWYRDDVKFHEVDITPAALSEFHQEFSFLVNMAVGGNWPGSPNSSTQFPQTFAVDYIRVFQ